MVLAPQTLYVQHDGKQYRQRQQYDEGYTLGPSLAQQLGIAYYTLADWRSIRRNTPPAKTLSAEEQSIRIRELEREVSELRTANDILKDALGFFAKDRKK